MAPISLHDLISALSGAVVQAQDTVEQHQLDLLGRYFDKQGRPDCLQIMVPKMGLSESAEDYTVLTVPRISLVETTLLHITEFQISFDVELGDLSVGATGCDPGAGNVLDHSPAGPDATPARGLFSGLSRFFGAPRVVPNIGPREVVPGGVPSGAASDPIEKPVDNSLPARDSILPNPPPQPQMTVGLGPKSTSVTTAKATLKVTAQPPSDGMVRLLNHLNKTF
jgi:hypothetical protein